MSEILNKGDQVRLKIYAPSAYIPTVIPIGEIGTIISDQDPNGLAVARFERFGTCLYVDFSYVEKV